jgi:hypothetical protein
VTNVFCILDVYLDLESGHLCPSILEGWEQGVLHIGNCKMMAKALTLFFFSSLCTTMLASPQVIVGLTVG